MFDNAKSRRGEYLIFWKVPLYAINLERNFQSSILVTRNFSLSEHSQLNRDKYLFRLFWYPSFTWKPGYLSPAVRIGRWAGDYRIELQCLWRLHNTLHLPAVEGLTISWASCSVKHGLSISPLPHWAVLNKDLASRKALEISPKA